MLQRIALLVLLGSFVPAADAQYGNRVRVVGMSLWSGAITHVAKCQQTS